METASPHFKGEKAEHFSQVIQNSPPPNKVEEESEVDPSTTKKIAKNSDSAQPKVHGYATHSDIDATKPFEGTNYRRTSECPEGESVNMVEGHEGSRVDQTQEKLMNKIMNEHFET